VFGKSRESRGREAAGRRNWPEAVSRKMSGRKTRRTEISHIRERNGGRHASGGKFGYRVQGSVWRGKGKGHGITNNWCILRFAGLSELYRSLPPSFGKNSRFNSMAKHNPRPFQAEALPSSRLLIFSISHSLWLAQDQWPPPAWEAESACSCSLQSRQ
jgi:hypothetical protein